MAVSPGEPDILRELRARSYAEGGVFWAREDELAVFDPEMARQVNAVNFRDLRMPDKLGDLLRGRSSEPFYWKDLRAVWIAQAQRLSRADGIRQLVAGMESLLDDRLDRPLDLVWATQEVVARALVPVVLAGLGAADTARVVRDQTLKLRFLLAGEVSAGIRWGKLRSILIQVSAGAAVRRELRGRASGRRPRHLDLSDPVVDLLPRLGMGRAVDAVTGLLTAIAGPPGGAATCMLCELTTRPDWRARLADELVPIPLEKLCAAPTRVAPETHRFVKECLRMWSPTAIMTRPVRTRIRHDRVCLEVGQSYLLSPDIVHHDPRHWKDPESFDPDRWHAAGHAAGSGACYVPFGWAPRTCIGAGLGTAQLIVLCHLMCTRYRIDLERPEAVRMALPSMPVPRNFRGTITRRRSAGGPLPISGDE